MWRQIPDKTMTSRSLVQHSDHFIPHLGPLLTVQTPHCHLVRHLLGVMRTHVAVSSCHHESCYVSSSPPWEHDSSPLHTLMMTTLSCYLELSFSISGHGSHPTIPKTKHAKVFLVCVFVLQKEIDTLESHELKVNRIFTSLVVCGAGSAGQRCATHG